ncbi:MAG: hypothetical protein LBR93_06800 [Treponema sp.]|jgi:hypothetical protein|nr:hypothetical protein [Treponema sp.]
MKRVVCLLTVLAALIPCLGAVDFTNGHIRLSLNPEAGRFSLYYLTGFSPLKFEPLFSHQDPRTSLLTAYYNEKAYKLGENSKFKIRLDNNELRPALVFESSFLRVTERFEFIKTGGSSSSNGVKITFLVENTGSRRADVGIRFLLDTNLGEGRPGSPLVTDIKPLNGETTFDSLSPDKWWISGNDRLSLMGSLGPEAGGRPDLVHVANWKRLNDTPWKLKYSEGRNFNNRNNPGDSAAAYYFEPRRIQAGESFSASLLLAANDPSGFIVYNVMTALEPPLPDKAPQLPTDPASPVSPLQDDINTLKDLLTRIDHSINSDFQISEEELLRMEEEIARLRSRYGIPEPR